ncbi:hypothetical protein KJQ97_06190 [Campylobacter sp. 2018MI01]|uniref:hypothetical protein n=1 Tax=Campylobacter sp. 2018MI01 TaxID=2836735 RepID=UPI001BDA9EE8|nr:hypothetical protein [Campylobacter sp. 2018MI01]MBT0879004.1 hypothetical protein [Campylobacter sp. 2018MI01]
MFKILMILLITNIYLYQINKLKIELDSIYKSFPYITKEIRQDQDEFLKNIRDCKDDNNCIINSYKTRIKELSTSLENSKTYPKELIEHIKVIQENSTECYKGNYVVECEETPLNNFWQDFFRYKDIKIKPKIVDAKPYASQEVKDTLKYCWDLGLDRRVSKTVEPNYGVYSFFEVDKNGELYFASKIKGKKYIEKHKNITISDVILDNKNYLALSGEFGDILFIEKDFCNHPMKNKDLLKLLKKSNKMKMSYRFYEHTKNVFAINYRERDYILSYIIYNNTGYSINLNSIFAMTSDEYYAYYKNCSFHKTKIEYLDCETNLKKEKL